MTQQRAVIAGVSGREPKLDEDTYTAPTSVVVGAVTMGPGSSLWYGAVMRGDCEAITLGEGSNIQDNCTVHADPGFPTHIGAGVSVGHNAVLHGCTVEDDVLVGMSATVLNGAVIGAGSLVAAHALVPQGMQVPPGSLVAGVPAKIKRELTSEEHEGIKANAAAYRHLARGHRDEFSPVQD
ncbi:gamma carbonic anhydrase family protein [Streptomyces sp. WMMB 322]|uniref:gamma carbonic anhydrase family protein n=1 Tax=Streptomyces sp. WMMB 322 TaxID=1286821 RepID=UPI0006E22942|nr:gamma carbonic anhydrase family protein [Streptomyces sp. WMMB 322]SCK58805.1 Carbonic anhydrase or acetyltransferase, isoleucine patch superfamily [Streptomyces sp. WMMB 322]